MKSYNWQGVNLKGQQVSGVEQAASIAQLKQILIAKNIFPVKIKRHLKSIFDQQLKIKSKNVADFIEQLSILINANLTLNQALIIISQDKQSMQICSLAKLCQQSIIQGNSLYKTWQSLPKYFNNIACGLVNVGEESGALDLALRELAEYLKRSMLHKKRLVKALLYPTIVIVVSIIVTTIFMLFIIPQFEKIFVDFGGTLPEYTRFIIALSKAIQNNVILVIIFIMIAISMTKIWYSKSAKFRFRFDRLLLKLPIVGKIMEYSTIARLTNTISITLKSGIPLLRSLEITSKIISNSQYQNLMTRAIKSLAMGQSLKEALVYEKLLPNQVIQLIALGEESGTLDLQLANISTIYEERLTNFTDNLNNLLEPIIMLILGIITGGLILGLYLPIFRLGSTI